MGTSQLSMGISQILIEKSQIFIEISQISMEISRFGKGIPSIHGNIPNIGRNLSLERGSSQSTELSPIFIEISQIAIEMSSMCLPLGTTPPKSLCAQPQPIARGLAQPAGVAGSCMPAYSGHGGGELHIPEGCGRRGPIGSARLGAARRRAGRGFMWRSAARRERQA